MKQLLGLWGALGSAVVMQAAMFSAEEIATESKKANEFFERSFDELVERSPEWMGYLGIQKNMDKWDDDSDAHQAENLAVAIRQLAELKRLVRLDALDEVTQVSYRLWVSQTERTIEGYRWRYHNYPVNQMFGAHSAIPAFLINIHGIDAQPAAEAYVARLRGIEQKIATLIEQLDERQRRGVLPPKFVFPLVLESSRNIIAGEPFTSGKGDSALWEDFKSKVGRLTTIDAAAKDKLIASARAALLESVKPAYERMIAKLEEQQRAATDDDGVWKLPEGGDFYNFALKQMTTTALTSEQIHAIGLREVTRIHAEMDALKTKVGFKGDLQAFFKFMREDKQFYYPNTAEGKAAYLAEATAIIDRMRVKLDDLFITKPQASIIVKAVEAFREKEAGGAFYQQPAIDGSRPGTYYVNLYDMGTQPKYEMEALAFHEGIPGHHMQIAIAQELKGVPKFRRLGGDYTAYIEGWGLYSELVPKEIGFYADPYSDFGRLSMELWRAARLVVDTGLHAKRWPRQQVIDWLKDNTPAPERECVDSANRYVVMPGQATAYKIGMIKIQELRELAKKELGAKFDVRAYHDEVLCQGALPLDVLEERVKAWLAKKRG